MSGPPPKEASTRARSNKASTKATLSLLVEHEVPALPPAEDWIANPFVPGTDAYDSYVPAWSKAVVDWWDSIWSSPMSNEFHESDNNQLFLAAFYLQQVVTPYAKIGERLKAAAQHEATTRNFGLNPMSRRSLQWEIERGEEAKRKGQKRTAAQKKAEEKRADTENEDDPRNAPDEDDENPFDQTPLALA